MACSYIVKSDDTLTKIAQRFYNNETLYVKLAEYNGILNPDLILVGQALVVPSRRELLGLGLESPFSSFGISPPNGLGEIIDTFGDIFSGIGVDGTLKQQWKNRHLGHSRLPYVIPLSWDRSRSVKNLYCHKKLKEVFAEVFAAIERKHLKHKIKTFGGCFNFRSQRTSGKTSTHSWGIAIDINPETNQPGTSGDMDLRVVDIFRELGFKWGGDWPGQYKDPMHFQYCTGY